MMTITPEVISLIFGIVSACGAAFWAVIVVPLKERLSENEEDIDGLGVRISKCENSHAVTTTRLEEGTKAIIERLEKIERLFERLLDRAAHP